MTLDMGRVKYADFIREKATEHFLKLILSNKHTVFTFCVLVLVVTKVEIGEVVERKMRALPSQAHLVL
jgi:hypothetical protein